MLAVLAALIPRRRSLGRRTATGLAPQLEHQGRRQAQGLRARRRAEIQLTATRKKTHTPVAGVMAAVMLINRQRDAIFGMGETDANGSRCPFRPLKKRVSTPVPVTLAYAHRTQVDRSAHRSVNMATRGSRGVPRQALNPRRPHSSPHSSQTCRAWEPLLTPSNGRSGPDAPPTAWAG